MSPPAASRDTDALIDRYLDGTADRSALAALHDALANDPAGRSRFYRRVLVEAHLHRLGATGDALAAPRRPAWWRRKVVWLEAAAVLAAALLGWWLVAPGRPAPGPHRVVAGQIEVAGLATGHLADGQTLRTLGESAAVLHLADATRVELEPGSEAALRGRADGHRQTIELLHGGGSFAVTPAAAAFRVAAGGGTVTAQSADFSVRRVEREGEPRWVAAVRTGKVVVESGGRTRTIGAGRSEVIARGKDAKERKARPTTRGQLAGVDTTARTVTLMRADGSTQTWPVASGAAVVIDRSDRSLAQAPLGVTVTLTFSGDGQLVTRLSANGPTVSGTIVSVDPAAGELLVRLAKDAGELRRIPLGPDTPIVSDGIAVEPFLLAVGDQVEVHYQVDQATVQEINVRPKRGK